MSNLYLQQQFLNLLDTNNQYTALTKSSSSTTNSATQSPTSNKSNIYSFINKNNSTTMANETQLKRDKEAIMK